MVSGCHPLIDWASREIGPREEPPELQRQQILHFKPCVPRPKARRIAGRRTPKHAQASGIADEEEALRQYYLQHGHVGSQGATKCVGILTLKKLLRAKDNEYYFFVAPSSEDPKAEAAWRALEGTPVYPLISRYRDRVFRSKLPDVPPSRKDGMDATITVADSTPVHRKQFPLSPEQKAAIQAWLQEMIKAGVIRPSSSPYCAPTFCVRKSNGEWRIVHDFRGLNAKVTVPTNPIPRKDEILRAMARGKIFSAMDLLWGFYQVRLDEKSIPYTAFATPDGLFEYLVTPMGISSSPSSFNRLVCSIFTDYRSFCQTYFDDLFVFTETSSMKDHLAALEKVLESIVSQRSIVSTFISLHIRTLTDPFQ
ncbi:unnamed protein product [Phytophthora fragariaefolia]|uniref:Unnamed protein product n=1 Tax=Phytophthora fragariaefolia TaxID=1490495 RepID=A0A9W6XZ61_9STRA|nr:unnamed protein product [Phytophthora fragariaefolia]